MLPPAIRLSLVQAGVLAVPKVWQGSTDLWPTAVALEVSSS